MVYASKMIILYGLAFFLAFYGIRVFNRVKKENNYYNMFVGGVVMGIVQSMLVIFVRLAQQTGMPDARFLMIGYTTFFIGPMGGLLAGVISSIVINIVNGTILWRLFCSQLVNIGFYCLVYYLLRNKRKPKYIEIILFVSISSSIVIPLASIIGNDNGAYLISLNHLPYLLVLASMLMCALLSVSYQEQENKEFIHTLEEHSKKLTQKNKEIECLYQQANDNQQKLQENLEKLTEYQERIEFLAYHDSQTGFFNREKLFDRLRHSKSDDLGRLGDMLLLGIKDSEKIEVSLGNVLVETLYYLVGIEIMSFFEEISNGQMYSIGKGRYVILINNDYTSEAVMDTFRRISDRFTTSIKINTLEMKVNMIAGAIHFTDEELEPEKWMEKCEFALYNASSLKGANQIIWFGQELLEQHSRELILEKDLYYALEKNELYLVYQPQYNNNQRICGAEALLRWRHPTLGEVAPGVFIPIAERNGLIDGIGKAVALGTCQFVDRNKRLFEHPDIHIPIAVNASFLELINPNFTERFLDILAQYHIPSKQIKVEVTESEVSLHYSELLQNLKLLFDSGIGVELDDFGTGYSSLNHLGIMPVQTIKIDKVFIDRILEDEKIGDLLEMIIDFAHRFKMKVVAEGVETKEQFLWLKKRKCDIYQGYYFSKPIKEEQLLELINAMLVVKEPTPI